MKAILCLIIMLTITPIAAATGLITYDPSRWGGEISLQNILAAAMFGLITVPVWFTYIPSLILTPILFKRLSENENFHTIPARKFYAFSALIGAMGGIFIVFPCIVLATSSGSFDITINWIWSGIVAGFITFPIISSLYRFSKPKELKR